MSKEKDNSLSSLAKEILAGERIIPLTKDNDKTGGITIHHRYTASRINSHSVPEGAVETLYIRTKVDE